jgi:glyceraldehyde-3-phosphate dehydrogenase (NADP+)
MICLGPYNYPLNETYATLIPSLLMGNVVIMKIPTIGGLCHLLTSKCDKSNPQLANNPRRLYYRVMYVSNIYVLCCVLVEAFSKALPPGTMNFVSGGGRATMPPLMATGAIDGLAFIGGSDAADDLIRQHPHPHRLKIFLQLEAKNMAVRTTM